MRKCATCVHSRYTSGVLIDNSHADARHVGDARSNVPVTSLVALAQSIIGNVLLDIPVVDDFLKRRSMHLEAPTSLLIDIQSGEASIGQNSSL